MAIEASRIPTDIKLGKELNRVPLVEIRMTPQELINSTVWEEYPFGQNGNTISGVVGHWGHNISNEELAFTYNYNGLKDKDGNEFTAQSEEISKPGFERRYAYPDGTTKEDALEVEIELGVSAIKRACELREVKPSEVKVLFVSGEFLGLPNTPDENAKIPRLIADMAGIDRSAKVIQHVLACNSGSEATRRIGELQKELDGEIAVAAEIEGLTKVASPHNLIDPGVPVFTNGFSARAIRIGKDYLIIPGRFDPVPDPKGSITGPYYYPKTPTDSNGFMMGEDFIRQMLQNPQNLDVGLMDASKTIRWVFTYVKPALVKSFRHFQEQGYFQNGVLVLSHPASRPVQDRLYEQASKELGVELNPVWYKYDGNSSCAASPAVVLRACADGVLKQAQEEDKDIFYFGFGVGGNCSGMILRDTNSAFHRN